MTITNSLTGLLSVAILLLIPWSASAQQCDTLSNVFTDDTLGVYVPDQTTGYVSGHNGYGDEAKADIFKNYPPNSEIKSVEMYFGVAKSSGPNATFDVKVWESTAGGEPGNVLTSKSVTYSSVVQDVNNDEFTKVTFNNPVPISGDFFVGIEFNYAPGDTIALYTAEFRSDRDSTAWEKYGPQFPGTWNPYGWGATSHAIFPIVCSQSQAIDAGIDSINRGEYTSYPQSQTAAIPFSGTITNFGNQSVTNPTLQVNVFDLGTTPPTPVYSDNQSISSLGAGNSVNLSMPSNFTPTDTGAYAVQYVSSIDENDANPANDTTVAFFRVDDSTYARDKFILFGADSLAGSVGFGYSSQLQLDAGQTFELFNNDTLTSISFAYNPDTAAAVGDTLRGNIYNFSPVTGPGGQVGQTEPFVIPDDSASFVTLSAQGGSIPLSSGQYLFTVNNVPFLLTTDRIYTPNKLWGNDPTAPSSWLKIDTIGGGAFQHAFVLWPNFGPTSTGGGGNCQNFSVSVSSQDEICGSGNGSVTASVSGGTSPYTYSWTNTSQTGSSISGLSAGTYAVTVTDDNQCTATATATVYNNNVTLNVSTSTTSAGCSGNNGSVTASVSNGTPQYSYSWSNNQNGPTIDNLSAGSYSVTVTDANGCTGTATATVSSGGGLSQVASFPLDYDSLDARAASNQPANQYERFFWDINENYTNTDNLTLDWGAQVYDSLYNYQTNTAYQKQNYTIRVDSILVPLNHTNTTGTNDTVIFSIWLNSTLSITGMPPNDQLTGSVYWSDTLIVSQSITPPDSLGALSLNIDTVLPSKGESFTFRTDFRGDTSNTFRVIAGYATSCTDSCGGRSSVIESRLGDNSQYYLNLTQQGQNLSGVNSIGFPGPPTCPSSCMEFFLQNFFFRPSISLLSSSSLSTSVSTTDDTCGSGSGSATVTVTSGKAPFSFDWNTGQTDSSISGLSAGTYTVTMTDADSCTVVDTATIGNANITLNVSITSQNTSCGSATGSATASVSNGSPQYSYSWSNNQSGPTINNITAGSYTVTVTDANGCTGTATATVTAPGAPTLNVTKNDISCNGADDGSATASASSGSGSYTFAWSNGSSNPSISGLSPGSYSVTVTDDSTNCDASSSITINEPSPLAVTLDTSTITCNGGSDGSVTANASGGTSPYNYTWNTGDQGALLTNVNAGTYIVTVSDDNNCTVIDTATVDEPSGFSISTNTTQADCNQSNGTAEVTSPTGNYSYDWSNGQSGQLITVGAGSYTVTVTNNNTSCDKTATVTVSNVGAPSIAVDTTIDVSCNGGSDGSATVSASGGTGLTYTWDDGTNGAQNTGLVQGTYSVTVEDQSGCIDATSVTINQPNELSISFVTTDASCPASSDGNAAANVTGGTPNYSYNWVNANSSSATASNLAAGNYILSVEDANNCDVIDTVSIDEPNPLAANTSAQDVSCNGGSDGQASVDKVTGGTPFSGSPSYSYSWSVSSSSASITGQTAGSYDVTITDANNCSIVETVTISEPQPLDASAMVGSDVSCNGDADGSVSAMGSGGTTPYEFSIDGGPYVTNNTFSNLSAGSKTISVRDDNGCTDDTTVTVNEPSPLTASIVQQSNVSCNGASDGSLAVDASGGTPTYSYSTDGNTFQTDSTFDGLDEGQVTVFVNDDNNCQTTVNTTINEPSPLSVDTNSVTDAIGGNNGAIDLSVSGGTAPYSYSWSNNDTIQNPTGLSPGSYTVTVTDENNCSATLTVTVEGDVGVTEASLDQNLTIYPNPTSGKVTLELEMAQRQDVTIAIYNVLGETMMKETLQDRTSYQKTMDFEKEAGGVYYVKLSTGERTLTRKIIVNR
jgi:hypothetical protein